MRLGMLLALAACGPSSSSDVDARQDAPGCAGMDFTLGDQLEGVLGGGHDPSASADPLELWYSRTGIVATYDVEAARRASQSAPFDMPINFLYNTMGIDRDPALSADGLSLVLVSEARAYELRRATTAEAFASAMEIPLFTSAVENGLELSADGLTLYVADNRRDLRAVHRPDRNTPFGAPSEILAQNIEYPTLTADELELYYSRYESSATYRRTRRSREAPFDDDERMVFGDAFEPDLTPDGQTLYVALNGSIWFLRRSCN